MASVILSTGTVIIKWVNFPLITQIGIHMIICYHLYVYLSEYTKVSLSNNLENTRNTYTGL